MADPHRILAGVAITQARVKRCITRLLTLKKDLVGESTYTYDNYRMADLVLSVVIALFLLSALRAQQPRVSSPKELIGFSIGDDYKLASYAQTETMWKKWATQSNRMKLVGIGKTAEGRPQYMAIISSPENIRRLDKYRQISKKLSLAEGLTDQQAHAQPASTFKLLFKGVLLENAEPATL